MRVYIYNYINDTEKNIEAPTEQELTQKLIIDFPWLRGATSLVDAVEHLDSTQMFSAEIF